MSCVASRAHTLRLLSSRLGYAFRHAMREASCLASSDHELFVAPIADVLTDIRQQLDVLMAKFPVTSAPSHVRTQMSFLEALASRPTLVTSSRAPVVICLADAIGDFNCVTPRLACSPSLLTDVGTDAMDGGLSCIRCGLWQPMCPSFMPVGVGGDSDQFVAEPHDVHSYEHDTVLIVPDADQVLYDVIAAVPDACGILASIWHDLFVPTLHTSVDRMGLHASPEYMRSNFITPVSFVSPDPRPVDGMLPLDAAALRRGLYIAVRDNVAGVESDIQVLLGLDVSHCRMRRYSFNLSDRFVMDYWREVLPPCAQVERMLGYLSDSD